MRRNLRWLCFTVLWFLPAQAETENAITIQLLDTAGLRPEVREGMKQEVARIFKPTGIEFRWTDCEIAGEFMNFAQCAAPLGKNRLMLQLIPGANKRHPYASGMAIIEDGSGVYACIYPDRVSDLAREAKWEFADLLGHAAAHEIGHLLLGTCEHSVAGIMRARWEVRDLRQLSHGGLVFLPGQLDQVITELRQESMPVLAEADSD